MSTTSDTLARLHDRYVEAVNIAVADDDMARVERLAAEVDVEALEVVRQRLSRPPDLHLTAGPRGTSSADRAPVGSVMSQDIGDTYVSGLR